MLLTVFYKSFYNFFLNLGFACIQGRKTFKFKSRKNRWKFTISPFFATGLIILAKGMKQCTTSENHFLKNTCNLGHSTVQCSVCSITFFTLFIEMANKGESKQCCTKRNTINTSNLMLYVLWKNLCKIMKHSTWSVIFLQLTDIALPFISYPSMKRCR